MERPDISTDGGAAVGSNVDTAGGSFVGRDFKQTIVDLERLARWVSIALVLAVLSWSAISYVTTMRLQAETQRIEARKPFLDRQLALYTEATQLAARLAAVADDPNKAEFTPMTTQRFWELYWGELVMVEDQEVESAMIAFGTCLQKNCKTLKRLSVELACACRKSLSKSWGVADLGMSASCVDR